MRVVDSSTGWMAYVRAYKEAYPEEVINYKTLMQQYIKGVSLQEVKL
jgi:hypothetical protein